MDLPMTVITADITTLKVDAIVNAANESLLGGGGVDGAIHRAAGPELLEECRAHGGCPTREVRVTKGYRLPARWVIHTVGPVWKGGDKGEPDLLAACYRRSIEAARELGAEVVAFPAISTGVYGYPGAEAANLAVQTVAGMLRDDLRPEVVFCCFSEESAAHHRAAMEAL
jgi:O-acetyl-ADP-ribose deacetylase